MFSLNSCRIAKSGRNKLSEHEYPDTDRGVKTAIVEHGRNLRTGIRV